MLLNFTNSPANQGKQQFNIIEEFSSLTGARKMLVCDHLFVEGRAVYEKTVKVLWPQAQSADIKKLEKFLHLLRKTAH
ncbi:MAG TPA: hypothetical protein DIU06_04235 [Rhodospirillaceae bacterium]|nr:hypothetical protein [Rhodospirillaceae bacterium]|tara:strand:- start:19336 stop:19569 length:234 start_codon:yes stop_codon:yes gene_type:complete